MEAESLEVMRARHKREVKDLQGRVMSKKKNATKKNRKGINEECAEMERQLRERQEAEMLQLRGEVGGGDDDDATEQLQPPGADDTLMATSIPCAADSDSSAATPAAGRKRNRQKERMARRAAEQEAEMLRAEEEAKGMTDRRAAESSYMKKQFDAHGLVEREILPDGHCLFSAVADQLAQQGIGGFGEDEDLQGEGEREGYKRVRRAAAEYMMAHAEDFAPFVEDGEELGAYVARVRDTAAWGGQLELTALARSYGVQMRVIQDGRTERIEEETEGGKTLWLAYYRHGYGLGEHYNSLRRR